MRVCSDFFLPQWPAHLLTLVGAGPSSGVFFSQIVKKRKKEKEKIKYNNQQNMSFLWIHISQENNETVRVCHVDRKVCKDWFPKRKSSLACWKRIQKDQSFCLFGGFGIVCQPFSSGWVEQKLGVRVASTYCGHGGDNQISTNKMYIKQAVVIFFFFFLLNFFQSALSINDKKNPFCNPKWFIPVSQPTILTLV